MTEGYVTHEGCDHIFFIGFLGAGKSTLARNLGRLYHRTYVDTDRMAERMMCKSVRECFEQDGESAFREVETSVGELWRRDCRASMQLRSHARDGCHRVS